jgi:hypothetical protein
MSSAPTMSNIETVGEAKVPMASGDARRLGRGRSGLGKLKVQYRAMRLSKEGRQMITPAERGDGAKLRPIFF